MNPEKSQTKIDVLENLGASVDDNLEASNAELKLCEGAAQVLEIALRKMEEMFQDIDKETSLGQLSPAHAVIAKKYSKKMIDFMSGFKDSAHHKLFMTKGRSEAYDAIVKLIKGQYDEEKGKLASFNAAAERTKQQLEQEQTEDNSEKLSPPRLDVLRSLGIKDTKELKRRRKK